VGRPAGSLCGRRQEGDAGRSGLDARAAPASRGPGSCTAEGTGHSSIVELEVETAIHDVGRLGRYNLRRPSVGIKAREALHLVMRR